MNETKANKSHENVKSLATRKSVSDNTEIQHGASVNLGFQDDARKMSSGGKTTSKMPAGGGPSREPKANERTVQVDLTDPEDLMKKLEILNLTEEEEDELLQQAYQLNQTLREELHKKEARADFTRSFVVSASKPKKSYGHKTLSASHLSPLYGNSGQSYRPTRSGHQTQKRQPALLVHNPDTNWTEAQRRLHKNPLPPPPRPGSSSQMQEPRPPQRLRHSSQQLPEKRSSKLSVGDTPPKE